MSLTSAICPLCGFVSSNDRLFIFSCDSWTWPLYIRFFKLIWSDFFELIQYKVELIQSTFYLFRRGSLGFFLETLHYLFPTRYEWRRLQVLQNSVSFSFLFVCSTSHGVRNFICVELMLSRDTLLLSNLYRTYCLLRTTLSLCSPLETLKTWHNLRLRQWTLIYLFLLLTMFGV